MKKIFIFLLTFILIIMFTTIASAEDFSMWKIGYGVGGQLQFTSSNSSGDNFNRDSVSSYSVGYEFITELNEKLELGAGAQFQAATFQKNNRFANMPVYLLLNYYPLTTDKMPYLTGRLGYHIAFNCNNDYFSSSEPAFENIYYGVGVGLKLHRSYRSIRFEALYTVSLGYKHYKDNYGQSNSPYLPPSYDFDAQILSNSVVLSLGFEF